MGEGGDSGVRGQCALAVAAVMKQASLRGTYLIEEKLFPGRAGMVHGATGRECSAIRLIACSMHSTDRPLCRTTHTSSCCSVALT